MNNRTIVFYGPLPPKGKAPFGGGEVGNQRTLNILQSGGYKIKVVRRLRTKAKAPKWQKKLSFPFRVLLGIIKFFSVLMTSSRKSLVHISGFYGSTIINEVLLLKIAKSLGFRVIYEMRGGGAVDYYKNLGKRYRKCFDYIVKRCDYLFSQGVENIPLIGSICEKEVFYYPNFVERDFSPDTLPEKPIDKWNIMYFGRLEKGKNILLIVDVVSALQNKYPNVNCFLIGSGQENYVKSVEEAMRKKLLPGSYMHNDSFKHDELNSYLFDKHFFIFPTESEGHSNALTEAMSYGVVPIASRRGFNPTVIGDDELLVEKMDVESFIKPIEKIIDSNTYTSYSKEVFERIKNNYTETIVSKRLLSEYDRLFNIV